MATKVGMTTTNSMSCCRGSPRRRKGVWIAGRVILVSSSGARQWRKGAIDRKTTGPPGSRRWVYVCCSVTKEPPGGLRCPGSCYSVKSWGKSGGKWEPGLDPSPRCLRTARSACARIRTGLLLAARPRSSPTRTCPPLRSVRQPLQVRFLRLRNGTGEGDFVVGIADLETGIRQWVV
jgi:hypothetical protein